MSQVPRRIEITKRLIRHEYGTPLERKDLHNAITWIGQQFERYNGRAPEYDNDYWIESMDEGIAFVFEVDELKQLPGGRE